MAVRIRTKFHAAGQRSEAVLASAVAIPAWKLAIESIKRMREARYDIDIGKPYFDFVCEFLVFMAMAADRIVYVKLEPEARAKFTAALVTKLAEFVEDNNIMLLGAARPGECRQHFIDLFNRRGADYAEFDYGPDGPDFGFKRYFAACLREGLPEKDRLWVVDQVMEIEVPDALKTLNRTLDGLFGGGEPPRRRRGQTDGD